MLINLFKTLKEVGVPCTLRELLDLISGLEKQVIFADINDFYYLSRSVLVKDEKHYDKFDRAFEIYPYVPVHLLMKNPFDTLGRAKDFAGPVLVIHSTEDEVIPVQHGRTLSQSFADVEYIEIGGYGHNALFMTADLPLWRQYVSFINQCVSGKDENE